MVVWKMIKLENSSVLDLLPQSIVSSDIITAAKILDIRFSDTVKAVNKINMYANLHDLEEAILDHLLFKHHVTETEGASLAATKEEKINLILNSDYMHEIKGTGEAIEHVLRLLNIRGKVSEWFEYGGDPYYFRLDLVEIENRGFGQRELTLLIQLINIYKNRRSWLDTIKVYLTTRTRVYHACSTTVGLNQTIHPYLPGEILTEVNVAKVATTVVGMQTEIGGTV